MWTTENRSRYDRSKLRYPSDLTDDKWALVEPLIPRAKRGGDNARSTRAKSSTRLRGIVPHLWGHFEPPAWARPLSFNESLPPGSGTPEREAHLLLEREQRR